MDEEKRRLQSTREEVGDASGGRRIDLESGTVRIARKAKAEDPAAEDETSEPAADAETSGKDTETPAEDDEPPAAEDESKSQD